MKFNNIIGKYASKYVKNDINMESNIPLKIYLNFYLIEKFWTE